METEIVENKKIYKKFRVTIPQTWKNKIVKSRIFDLRNKFDRNLFSTEELNVRSKLIVFLNEGQISSLKSFAVWDP